MRKIFKAISLVLSALIATTAVSCASSANRGDKTGEKVDPNRTQLRVFYYAAGYGNAWIQELKVNFEKAYKDVSFEDGKVGVQIMPRGEMKDFTVSDVRDGTYDVLFLEAPKNYYSMMTQGILEPLDSFMEEANPNDGGKSIASKMTEQQRSYYYYNNHYYGIPHYAGSYGIVYNKDMFDEKGFYLAATPDEDTGDILISKSNPEKSVGPDGKKGTDDDGLPRTYDEFFALCDEINARGVDPICFPSQYREHHLNVLMDNLVANHLGAGQTVLNCTFNGTADSLLVLNADGSPKKGADGKFITESKVITEENGYELARQDGKYYAMNFIYRLLSNKDYYPEKTSTEGTTTSHTMNQQMYLENESRGLRPSAMLADGVWWQMEADGTFRRMAARDEKYSKANRNFGWMQLPQATEEDAEAFARGDKKSVYSDYLNAVACVKAGLPDYSKRLAFEFLKFAYTDDALAKFTYTTGAIIGMDYLDSIDMSKLNYFSRSVVNAAKNSDLAYRVSSSAFYNRNINKLSVMNLYANNIGGNNYKTIVPAILEGKVTGEDYFKSYQSYFKNQLWS